MTAPLTDKHVAIVGFMGAGKSTIGADAATRAGRPFLDLDEEIQRRTGSTIVELFAAGESAFRNVEEEIVCDVLARTDPHVLALGGGAVLSERTRAELRRRATTLLVDVDLDDAWRRVEGSSRPLAQGRERFAELYEERRPLYGQVADATVKDADDVVPAGSKTKGIPDIAIRDLAANTTRLSSHDAKAGAQGAKVIVTYIVEKGKPLASPVK